MGLKKESSKPETLLSVTAQCRLSSQLVIGPTSHEHLVQILHCLRWKKMLTGALTG